MANGAKSPAIRNISDTARWVAFYRAMETERPDAIFQNPSARKLTGERGEQIVHTLKRGTGQAWAMVVRTKLMDDILLSAKFHDFYQASVKFKRPMPGGWMILTWKALMPRQTEKMMKQWRSGVVLLKRN